MLVRNLLQELLEHGFNYEEWFHFKVEDPKPFVEDVLEEILHEYKWLPEYDEIVDWMKDNKGKGLILCGKNGLGKTIFAKVVIPAFFLAYFKIIMKFYNVYEMNDRLDEILTKKFIILDDVGNEDQKMEYGERRLAFPEIIDYVEQRNRLIVITSNLSPQGFETKYGIRTRDRIKACCRQIVFKGDSLRR